MYRGCILYICIIGENVNRRSKGHQRKGFFAVLLSNLTHNVWCELTLFKKSEASAKEFQSGPFQVPTDLVQFLKPVKSDNIPHILKNSASTITTH